VCDNIKFTNNGIHLRISQHKFHIGIIGECKTLTPFGGGYIIAYVDNIVQVYIIVNALFSHPHGTTIEGSIVTQNNYFPLIFCHVSCSNLLRLVYIPRGNYIPDTCKDEIGSPLLYLPCVIQYT
jgi:hypothetical protein